MSSKEWIELSMDEAWDMLRDDAPENIKSRSIRPKFPTRRWGDITTKTSTTDLKAVVKILNLFKEKQVKAKKIIDHESTEKFKNTSGNKKFYKIIYFENPLNQNK